MASAPEDRGKKPLLSNAPQPPDQAGQPPGIGPAGGAPRGRGSEWPIVYQARGLTPARSLAKIPVPRDGREAQFGD
jgi:hypothetical protein